MLASFAFAQVETPSIGTMLDASGVLRAVQGIAGNFTLGPPTAAEEPPPPNLERGVVLASLPGDVSPVLVTTRGIAFVMEGELIFRRTDARQVRFVLNGVVALRSMSADWVQVTTETGMFALRIESGKEELFALPGMASPEVTEQ
jgi:hypothetical protein